MRLRTRGLPLRLTVLCILLLAPLSALQQAPATVAAAAANAIEDTFTRANQTGWGSSTNTDGVPTVAWGLDGDGTKAYVTISGNTGAYGYQGSTNVIGIGSAGSTPYNGGDDLVRFAVSAVGHAAPYVVQNACSDKSCYYGARLHTAQNKLELAKRSGGSTSILASVPFTPTASTFYWMRLDVTAGTTDILRAKVWAEGTSEPSAWMVTTTDSSPLAANVAGTGGSWDQVGTGESIQYTCYAYVTGGLATPCPTTPYQVANGRLDVSVGYADSVHGSPNLPTPWRGAPNTLYVVPPGQDPTTGYDSGTIRLDNTTASSVTVQAVTVTIHNSSEVFNLWGSFTIPPNNAAILAQTTQYNFDTSDVPSQGTLGATCQVPLGPTVYPPAITIALSDGTQATVSDTGHILDAGGVDSYYCGSNQNESLAWRAIGTVGVASTTANLILTASTATSFAAVNTPATILANLKDAANILPLANVTARFQVLSGPNAGLSGQGLTDS